MKNQYFGDINDYFKYGLIRTLSGDGKIRTAICWMLTPDDSGNEGSRTDYLNQPKKWRHFDPELYDHLVVGKRIRSVQAIESEKILKNCRFFSDILNDNSKKRCLYFEGFSRISSGSDLVFFDPDKGLEVKSIPYGRKSSSMYLYWREVVRFFTLGHSLLIYQHFPRMQRNQFILKTIKELANHTCFSTIYSFCTSNVVFLLVPQARHLEFFQNTAKVVNRDWKDQINIKKHEIATGASLRANLDPGNGWYSCGSG